MSHILYVFMIWITDNMLKILISCSFGINKCKSILWYFESLFQITWKNWRKNRFKTIDYRWSWVWFQFYYLFRHEVFTNVCRKYRCICCRSHKNSYSEVESFFLENKARSHLEGGLGRDSTDWFDINRRLSLWCKEWYVNNYKTSFFHYSYITFKNQNLWKILQFCHVFFD